MTKKREYNPEAIYHITMRGRNKQKLFKDAEDFIVFEQLLARAHKMYSLEIQAYCIMSNHYHLMCKSPKSHLAPIMQFLNHSYTWHFKNKYNHVGSLYEHRYHAIILSKEAYVKKVSNYIHLNPVHADLVESPEDYPYSSYRTYHFDHFKGTFISPKPLLNHFSQSSQAYCNYCSKHKNLPKSAIIAY